VSASGEAFRPEIAEQSGRFGGPSRAAFGRTPGRSAAKAYFSSLPARSALDLRRGLWLCARRKAVPFGGRDDGWEEDGWKEGRVDQQERAGQRGRGADRRGDAQAGEDRARVARRHRLQGA